MKFGCAYGKNRVYVPVLLLIILLISPSIRVTSAQSSAVFRYQYQIERPIADRLFYDELTLVFDIGAREVVSVTAPAATADLTFWVEPGEDDSQEASQLIVTTDADSVMVELRGEPLPDPQAAVSLAALKDNKAWAWSHGMDDNTMLEGQIDILNEKNWPGTLFLIGNVVDDVRDEGWIIDVPDINRLLPLGWAIGNHTIEHVCYNDEVGKMAAQVSAADGRLRAILDQSPMPDFKVVAFAAPCFDANYHPIILERREAADSDLLFNESGGRGLLRVDPGLDPANEEKIDPEKIQAAYFTFDRPIGRDLSLEIEDVEAAIAYADWMSANSGPTHHYWYNTLTHGQKDEPLAAFVDYLYTTYGPDGTNELWAANSSAVYSYLMMRDHSTVKFVGMEEERPDDGDGERPFTAVADMPEQEAVGAQAEPFGAEVQPPAAASAANEADQPGRGDQIASTTAALTPVDGVEGLPSELIGGVGLLLLLVSGGGLWLGRNRRK